MSIVTEIMTPAEAPLLSLVEGELPVTAISQRFPVKSMGHL